MKGRLDSMQMCSCPVCRVEPVESQGWFGVYVMPPREEAGVPIPWSHYPFLSVCEDCMGFLNLAKQLSLACSHGFDCFDLS